MLWGINSVCLTSHNVEVYFVEIKHLLINSYDHTLILHGTARFALDLSICTQNYLLHCLWADVTEVVWECFSRNEYFKPFFWVCYLLSSMAKLVKPLILISLYGHLFISGITSVVQEWHWLSKTNKEVNFSIILLNFNITNSFTNVVQIFRALNNVFD